MRIWWNVLSLVLKVGRVRAGELPGPSVPVGHVWQGGVQLLRQVVRSGGPHLLRPLHQTGEALRRKHKNNKNHFKNEAGGEKWTKWSNSPDLQRDLNEQRNEFSGEVGVTQVCLILRTTILPELSCSIELLSPVKRWRSKTTSPTSWAATTWTEWPPSGSSEDREFRVCSWMCLKFIFYFRHLLFSVNTK